MQAGLGVGAFEVIDLRYLGDSRGVESRIDVGREWKWLGLDFSCEKVTFKILGRREGTAFS